MEFGEKDGLVDFGGQLQEGAEVLEASKGAAGTLTVKASFETDFPNAITRAYPELKVAVIARVEYNTAGPSAPEWNSYYSPAGTNTLWGTDKPFDGFVNRVSPTVLSVTGAQGKTHRFTASELARGWNYRSGLAPDAIFRTKTETNIFPAGTGRFPHPARTGAFRKTRIGFPST